MLTPDRSTAFLISTILPHFVLGRQGISTLTGIIKCGLVSKREGHLATGIICAIVCSLSKDPIVVAEGDLI